MDPQVTPASLATVPRNLTQGSQRSGSVATLSKTSQAPMYTVQGISTRWSDNIINNPSFMPQAGHSVASNGLRKCGEEVAVFPTPPDDLNVVPRSSSVEVSNMSELSNRSPAQSIAPIRTSTYATPNHNRFGRIEVAVSSTAVSVSKEFVQSMVTDGSVNKLERWCYPAEIHFYPKGDTEVPGEQSTAVSDSS
jgi:hypothetical protein